MLILEPFTAECVTIHKSQGQSVDNVLIMLNKSNFRGLLYVAASRARSSKGLFFILTQAKSDLTLEDFNMHNPAAYEKIHSHYKKLRQLEHRTGELSENARDNYILEFYNMGGRIEEINNEMADTFLRNNP